MTNLKHQLRQSRHKRIRNKVSGSADRPRLAIFRSNKFIYAQIIDDKTGKTLLSASDLKLTTKGSKIDKAYNVGAMMAKVALKQGIKKIVFDRGGYLYHGRVQKLADGMREGGLEF